MRKFTLAERKEMKKEIEKTAKEANVSVIEIISIMQSSAKTEENLSILCYLKNRYINKGA